MLSKSRVHATIPAVDLDRARKWYEETFEIQPVEDRPGGLIYELGEGSRFMLTPALPGECGLHDFETLSVRENADGSDDVFFDPGSCRRHGDPGAIQVLTGV